MRRYSDQETTIDQQYLAQLVEAVERLNQTLTLMAPDAGAPLDCRLKTCTYFEHYLAQGPAELVHEGYHAAERKCAAAQAEAIAHEQSHTPGETDCSRCAFLNRVADKWVERIRA